MLFGMLCNLDLRLSRWPSVVYEGQPLCVITVLGDPPLPQAPVAADPPPPPSAPAAPAVAGPSAKREKDDVLLAPPCSPSSDDGSSHSGDDGGSCVSSDDDSDDGSDVSRSVSRVANRAVSFQPNVDSPEDADLIDTDEDENGDFVVHRAFMFRVIMRFAKTRPTREVYRSVKDQLVMAWVQDSSFLSRGEDNPSCPRDCLFCAVHCEDMTSDTLTVICTVGGHMFKRQTMRDMNEDVRLSMLRVGRRFGVCMVRVESLGR